MNPEDLNDDTPEQLERERVERLKPKGERVVIDAPDLTDHATVDGIGVLDTDLKHAFLHKYGHLFCMDRGEKNEGAELHAYTPEIGTWSSSHIRETIHAQVATMSKNIIRTEFNDLMANMQTAAPEDRDQYDRQRSHLTKLIQRWGKATTISSIATMVYNHLAALHKTKPIDMNPDPLVLNCPNGVVDLRTGVHRHHKPEDYLTATTGTTFDPDADYSEWEKSVREIFCRDNEQMYEFMHRWIGYSITGLRWDHAIVVLFGNGNNGKSLFTDAIANMLGDYACKLPGGFGEENSDSNGNNELYAKANLIGVRFALMSEAKNKSKINSSMIKALTGDDTISARRAHKDYKVFKATHKFTLATNHTPHIPANDNAMFNRLLPVHTMSKFGTAEQVEDGDVQYVQDSTLLDRCSKPRGRSAILLWAVKGAQKYLADGRLKPPAEVLQQNAKHRKNMDVIGTFVNESTQYIGKAEVAQLIEYSDTRGKPEKFAVWEKMDKCQIECNTFFDMYVLWCQASGVDKRKMDSKSDFNEYLLENGRMWTDEDNQELKMEAIKRHRTAKAYLYRWVKLTPDGAELLKQAIYRSNRTPEY